MTKTTKKTPTGVGWLLITAALVAVVGIAWAIYALAGGPSTTSFENASLESQAYARSYCESEAAFEGRPDHGSRFEACLDKQAIARDAAR